MKKILIIMVCTIFTASSLFADPKGGSGRSNQGGGNSGGQRSGFGTGNSNTNSNRSSGFNWSRSRPDYNRNAPSPAPRYREAAQSAPEQPKTPPPSPRQPDRDERNVNVPDKPYEKKDTGASRPEPSKNDRQAVNPEKTNKRNSGTEKNTQEPSNKGRGGNNYKRDTGRPNNNNNKNYRFDNKKPLDPSKDNRSDKSVRPSRGGRSQDRPDSGKPNDRYDRTDGRKSDDRRNDRFSDKRPPVRQADTRRRGFGIDDRNSAKPKYAGNRPSSNEWTWTSPRYGRQNSAYYPYGRYPSSHGWSGGYYPGPGYNYGYRPYYYRGGYYPYSTSFSRSVVSFLIFPFGFTYYSSYYPYSYSSYYYYSPDAWWYTGTTTNYYNTYNTYTYTENDKLSADYSMINTSSDTDEGEETEYAQDTADLAFIKLQSTRLLTGDENFIAFTVNNGSGEYIEALTFRIKIRSSDYTDTVSGIFYKPDEPVAPGEKKYFKIPLNDIELNLPKSYTVYAEIESITTPAGLTIAEDGVYGN